MLITLCIIAFLILVPYLFFGAAVGALLAVIATRFNVFWLFVSVATFVLAGFLYANSTPDPSVEWISTVESVAQSHVLGISIPSITALIGLAIFILAFRAAKPKRAK